MGKKINTVSKKGIRLISIRKSKREGKKYTATFEIKKGKNISRKTTHFGAKNMSDYTKHKDKERRGRYISRHKKDLNTKDPTRAGYLAMFILWNKPTLSGSILDYKKRLRDYNKTGRFNTKI